MSSLRPWESSSWIWDRTTMISLTILRLHSSEKEVRSCRGIVRRFTHSSPNTPSLKKTTSKREETKRSNTPITLRNCEPRMRMTNKNKRLSSKRKCKCFRSAWRTWGLSTSSMKRNLNSTTESSRKEIRSILWPSRTSREGRTSSELMSDWSVLHSNHSPRSSLMRTRSPQRSTKSSPIFTCNFSRSLRGSKRLTKTGSMKSGQWIKMKSWLSVRLSRTVIESSTFNNLELLGNHHLIQSSLVFQAVERIPLIQVKSETIPL